MAFSSDGSGTAAARKVPSDRAVAVIPLTMTSAAGSSTTPLTSIAAASRAAPSRGEVIFTLGGRLNVTEADASPVRPPEADPFATKRFSPSTTGTSLATQRAPVTVAVTPLTTTSANGSPTVPTTVTRSAETRDPAGGESIAIASGSAVCA